jgi:hypothetical protein
MRSLLIATSALLCICSCGKPRRFGDEGGVPATFTVHLERAFVGGMKNRQARPSLGVGAGIGSGGHSSFGTGVGLTFSSTVVHILGGEEPGSGNVFIKEIEWGDNTFTVPLTPGRTLTLSVEASGGREGWESIGTLTVPQESGSEIHLDLTESGGTATVRATSTTSETAPAESK